MKTAPHHAFEHITPQQINEIKQKINTRVESAKCKFINPLRIAGNT